MKKPLSNEQQEELLKTLRSRFEKNIFRHKNISWKNVQVKLESNPAKLCSLYEMENTGGEPDVVDFQNHKTGKKGEYTFVDCSIETPAKRRSLCYDNEGLESRKEHKPKNSALELASSMGIELLNENQYRELQTFGPFDTKTSSWIATPSDIRKLGGALFADFRYGKTFIYHNGASSYYAVRGFRGLLIV